MQSMAANNPLASRDEGVRVALELRDVDELFNSLDPSPLPDRDLSPDAADFISASAEEEPPDAPLSLRIYLRRWPDNDPSEVIQTAIHHYFAYRARVNHIEFRRLMKRGRTSLFIGSLFLTFCILVTTVIIGKNNGTWAGIARESLTIAGWVAMWRPMEIYLYDWWPLRRRGRVYEKLSEIPVEVVHATGR
jgi:hypothetical protein